MTVDLRFPGVEAARPHYESVYCALAHPAEPEAVWIRTTVQKRPGMAPTGALWVTWFGEQGISAGKLNDLPVQPGGHGLVCGPATQGTVGSRGELEVDGISARWDLTFASRTRELKHLHPDFLYRAPLPRTKSTSPVPDLEPSGSLVVNGRQVDLTGWTGMLGHNWGSEHAARWIWLRASGLGDDGLGWLDTVLGRVRVGPTLSPWTAFGAIELDGSRQALGGLFKRGTAVSLIGHGASIALAGRGVAVEVEARVSPGAIVGWEYSDPGGHRHEVVNSSVTEMSVVVDRAGRRSTFTPVRRGVLEIGGDERAFDVPLQPYPD
jgi:hypothetical protein